MFKEKIQASLQKFHKVVYILYLYFPNGLYWLCLQLISKCSKRKSRPAFKIGNPAGLRSSSSQCSGDCHQRQLCTTSERTCISPATPVLMMMVTLMTMIMNMIMMMMMTVKTMEIVIKAYVYFPSDSCTNGLCRSQTRGVISLEGASSHIKYNCLSNKYTCFVCYRVLKSN